MPYHPHRKVKNSPHKRLDQVMSVVAIVSPFIMLPQIIDIYSTQNAGSISIVSWLGSAVTSLIWFLYGSAHKEFPIVFNSGLGVIIALTIVLGAWLY